MEKAHGSPCSHHQGCSRWRRTEAAAKVKLSTHLFRTGFDYTAGELLLCESGEWSQGRILQISALQLINSPFPFPFSLPLPLPFLPLSLPSSLPFSFLSSFPFSSLLIPGICAVPRTVEALVLSPSQDSHCPPSTRSSSSHLSFFNLKKEQLPGTAPKLETI